VGGLDGWCVVVGVISQLSKGNSLPVSLDGMLDRWGGSLYGRS